MPTPAQFSTVRIQIGGVPVIELARQFGTPAYVYDVAKIVERINDLRAFDSIRAKGMFQSRDSRPRTA
jgi:diaminopimelate decarboxylase